MAFLGALLLSAVIIFGAFRYLVNPNTRSAAHKALIRNPGQWAFVILGVSSLMVFFWGVVIPSFGEIAIPISDHRSIRLWQIGGVSTLIWTVLWFWIGEKQ